MSASPNTLSDGHCPQRLREPEAWNVVPAGACAPTHPTRNHQNRALTGAVKPRDGLLNSRDIMQRALKFRVLEMCGRIIQSSDPLRLAIVEGLDFGDSRMGNIRPRYNPAPSQELLVIRENHKTGYRSARSDTPILGWCEPGFGHNPPW
jgi:hypothetical protein